MKKIGILLGSLLTVLSVFSVSVYADDSSYSLDYKVLKYQSTDVSIANDYFEKPLKVYEQDGNWYISVTVNHANWITDLEIQEQKAVKKTEGSDDTMTWVFELDEFSDTLQATIKVDIDEEVDGEMLNYHNSYHITFSLDEDEADTISLVAADIKKRQSEAACKCLLLYTIYGLVIILVLIVLIFGIRHIIEKRKASI